MDQQFQQKLEAFFKKAYPGEKGACFDQLPGDGSHRVFWRISNPEPKRSFIAMANPPKTPARERENHAYLMIARHLRLKGLPFPVIHQYDLAEGWFIMEDLGSSNLQDVVLSGKDPLPVYHKVLEHLFPLQVQGGEGFDPAWCCQTERYDRTVMQKYEAHYFRDAFLKGFLGYDQSLPGLETAFDHLAEKASRADGRFFMHRDFQSRNIMVMDEKIGIIDWQGGRLGPLAYDLSSLLIDPYVRLSDLQKKKIYDAYVDRIKDHNPAWVAPFERDYPYLAIQRNLQILGAFSFLSKVMKKTYFEAYIPSALKTLVSLIDQAGDHGLKPLKQLVSSINLPNNL
ncbi:MAG: phosphotransferase [Deltaproteobacteria bacterium]|nr:phosphotransferase [Deltaproteobacteria bacterium]